MRQLGTGVGWVVWVSSVLIAMVFYMNRLALDFPYLMLAGLRLSDAELVAGYFFVG